MKCIKIALLLLSPLATLCRPLEAESAFLRLTRPLVLAQSFGNSFILDFLIDKLSSTVNALSDDDLGQIEPVKKIFLQKKLLDCRYAIVSPIDGHTKLQLEPEGLDIIRNLEGPFSPVVVIGPYRSGKSFLLNQVLGVGCGKCQY